MATSIVMPQMGYDMHEGKVVRWLKKEGEEVVRGEVIAEIETDKATVEYEAHSGDDKLRGGDSGRHASRTRSRCI